MASPKKSEIFVSRFGTNLRLTILEVKKQDLRVEIERKIINRKTGEVSIEKRERVVPIGLWPCAIAGYVQA